MSDTEKIQTMLINTCEITIDPDDAEIKVKFGLNSRQLRRLADLLDELKEDGKD